MNPPSKDGSGSDLRTDVSHQVGVGPIAQKKRQAPQPTPKRRIEGTTAFRGIIPDGWALARYQLHLIKH